jgi:hypothetical protein
MIKHVFIFHRNAVVGATPRQGADDGSELLGEMYDNVFLRGHVSGEGKTIINLQQRFIPGYLAIFL